MSIPVSNRFGFPIWRGTVRCPTVPRRRKCRSQILGQLKEIPDISYGVAYQNLLNAANERLNRPLKNGFRMEGQLSSAKLDSIQLLADGVSIALRVSGDLKILYGL